MKNVPDDGTACACGHSIEEHTDERKRIGACEVDDCPCVYFDAEPDADD